MYKKREFTEGAFYHVTSRTNDKIRVFENNLGRKIMLITLQDAKEKFHYPVKAGLAAIPEEWKASAEFYFSSESILC
jgi:hypothetical protein